MFVKSTIFQTRLGSIVPCVGNARSGTTLHLHSTLKANSRKCFLQKQQTYLKPKMWIN